MNMSDAIMFVLDGQLHTIRFDGQSQLKPSTTVLNYLRSLHHHKGVKEGCAEGDCGACTVVVASADEKGQLRYEALDSCLVFLPYLHGKQLITVENLKTLQNGTPLLHPVQQSMVTQNGSQCGYCTPGIVMSLFGLYKNHQNPSREVILDALTGNLCRCTGYNPIVEAAKESCCHNGQDQFSAREKEVFAMLQPIAENTADKELTGGGQKYFLPATLESALRLKVQYPSAILVSGATDVALRQTKKMEHLPLILDISAVRELDICLETSDSYVLGAGLKLERMKQFVKTRLPAMYDMLAVFGSLQIRHMATLGGNVGSASPIGDTLPLLFVYQARVHLAHANGTQRNLPVEDFITGYRQTALDPHELIHSVSIPKPAEDWQIKSYKISRRKDLDISTVSAAFALRTDSQWRVKEIRMAYGGMAAKTQRASRAEEYLKGRKWEHEAVSQAMTLVEQEFTPISDARSDKQARKVAASNLLLKFFHQTSQP